MEKRGISIISFLKRSTIGVFLRYCIRALLACIRVVLFWEEPLELADWSSEFYLASSTLVPLFLLSSPIWVLRS